MPRLNYELDTRNARNSIQNGLVVLATVLDGYESFAARDLRLAHGGLRVFAFVQ
jgi:hypothetical protein